MSKEPARLEGMTALQLENKSGKSSNRPSREKAAAILATLGEDQLLRLQGKLPDYMKEKVTEAVRSLRSVPKDELAAIATEFATRFARERNAIKGGDEAASRLDGTLFDSEPDFEPIEFDQVLEGPDDSDDPLSGWKEISELPIDRLNKFFAAKPSIIVSVALRYLEETVASELSGMLPDDLAKDALVQVAISPEPNPLAVQTVEQMVRSALMTEEVVEDDDVNPSAEKIANILNRLTATRREMVLTDLKEQLSASQYQDIMSRVLTFDALSERLPRSAIPILFRELEEKPLLTSIRFAQQSGAEVGDYLLNNISQRMAGQYRETMERMAPTDQDESEKAQSAVVCKVLELAEAGRIDLLEAPSTEG